MKCFCQASHHFRFVGIGTVVQIADDLFCQSVKRFFRIHFFHRIYNDIACDDLIFLIGIQIFLKCFLVKGQQVDPEDFFAFKFWIFFDIFDHKPDQVKEFPGSDQQMHSHHHIEMADQFSRIITFALQSEETHQFPSCFIFDFYGVTELFYVERSVKTCF